MVSSCCDVNFGQYNRNHGPIAKKGMNAKLSF